MKNSTGGNITMPNECKVCEALICDHVQSKLDTLFNISDTLFGVIVAVEDLGHGDFEYVEKLRDLVADIKAI